MRIKLPESCQTCVTKKEYDGIMVCTCPVYSQDEQMIDVCAYKIPEEGIPDWCPTKLINEKMKLLGKDQQSRIKKIIEGITALFGIEGMIEEEEDEDG